MIFLQSYDICKCLWKGKTNDIFISACNVLYYRTVKNNSIKLMIVGKHQKGKTTLLEHLSRVGDFEDLSVHQPPEESNAKSVGIKMGIWKYCKYRGNPTNDHPTIEFYSWDYAGEVCTYVYVCCGIVPCMHYIYMNTQFVHYKNIPYMNTLILLM